MAIGGALGAGCRWCLLSLSESVFDDSPEDVVIFLLNIIGSCLLGAAISQRPHLSEIQFHFVGAGFAGGFTTFSTFALDIARLIDDGQLMAATISTTVTSVVAVVFAGIGYRIGREARR